MCVRIVQTNGIDLSLFQFDFDLTFAVFFLNADGTIYGRFGTRTEREQATRDISIEGFRQALEKSLELHAAYPANKSALAGKRGPAASVKSPELYPSLRKYRSLLDYDGKVAQSCIHCHMVRAADRQLIRSEGKPLPDVILYPWPDPRVVGLELDSKACARVSAVTPSSPASDAGFQPGDELVELRGQPLVSIADVQWVLHNAESSEAISARVRRGEKTLDLELALPEGWRRRLDISWRTTTWDLRRMAAGGLLLQSLTGSQREKLGLTDGQLALRVHHVGQYGEHAAAKHAGFRKEDIIVEVDGSDSPLTETEFLARGAQRTKPGDRVPITVLRDGKRVRLKLPMQ